MAVPVPRTWQVGEVLTAANMNAYMRDPQNFLLGLPTCRAYDGAGVNQANNTSTLVTWDSNSWDTRGMHSTSTNTGRIVFPEPGIYNINIFLRWLTNGTGVRTGNLRTGSGGNPSGGISVMTANTAPLPSNQPCLNMTRQLAVDANDYIEVFATQTSGAALKLDAGGSFIEVNWLRNKPS